MATWGLSICGIFWDQNHTWLLAKNRKNARYYKARLEKIIKFRLGSKLHLIIGQKIRKNAWYSWWFWAKIQENAQYYFRLLAPFGIKIKLDYWPKNGVIFGTFWDQNRTWLLAKKKSRNDWYYRRVLRNKINSKSHQLIGHKNRKMIDITFFCQIGQKLTTFWQKIVIFCFLSWVFYSVFLKFRWDFIKIPKFEKIF